jgi:hypothetical protein
LFIKTSNCVGQDILDIFSLEYYVHSGYQGTKWTNELGAMQILQQKKESSIGISETCPMSLSPLVINTASRGSSISILTPNLPTNKKRWHPRVVVYFREIFVYVLEGSSSSSSAPPSLGSRSGAPYHLLNFGPPVDRFKTHNLALAWFAGIDCFNFSRTRRMGAYLSS